MTTRSHQKWLLGQVLFVLELALNIFVNWWRPFLHEWWNIFDFVVVSVSVVSLFTASVVS